MSNEKDVRLKTYTLFVERVLFFPKASSNEHRLQILIHIITNHNIGLPIIVSGPTTRKWQTPALTLKARSMTIFVFNMTLSK